MPRMTPEQEARYALDFGVARSDLPEAAQLAYDRLAGQRARAQPPASVSPASTKATRFSPAGLRAAMAADVIVIAAAVAFYLVIAVTNIASWPANRVLISASHGGALFLALWLLSAFSVASNVLLYGWPGKRSGPASMLRAMYWAARSRPSWAKLPPSMRRPPRWMWLLLALAAAGSAAVMAGSFAAGLQKGESRVLPGPRHEVSTYSLPGAWTQVSHAAYQVYAADFMRVYCLMMPIIVVLITNSGYALFLRRELLQSSLASSRSPAS